MISTMRTATPSLRSRASSPGGHCLHILNAMGDHIGTVQQRVLTFLPKFELYIGKLYYGCIRKGIHVLHPALHP